MIYSRVRLKQVVYRMDEQQQEAVGRLTVELDSAQDRAAQLDDVSARALLSSKPE